MADEVKKVETGDRLSCFISEIRKNEKRGLAAFYEHYKNMIFRIALSICRSYSVAEEVLDDVLCKVWKRARGSEKKEVSEGWLYVITINSSKSKMKQGNKVLPLSDTMPEQESASEIEKMIAKNAFLSMLEGLTDEELCIIVGKFSLSKTFNELSEDLERPISTISTIYYNALKKIKKNFSKNF